jgi:hypothetical protein
VRLTGLEGEHVRIARGLSVLTLAVATLVLGAITYKQASGCAMHLTGGTETGHATSTYSHWNGYKLDFSLNSCLDNHITTNWAALGGDKWEAPSGNVYYREADHWDVTYYTCGC